MQCLKEILKQWVRLNLMKDWVLFSHLFFPDFYFFFLLKSTLGYVALLISTFHVLIYGWKRAFEEEYYRFYTPPNFVLALVLPSIVILGKIILLLPCVSRKLRRIRRGWEKSHAIEETSGSVPHFSPERITVM